MVVYIAIRLGIWRQLNNHGLLVCWASPTIGYGLGYIAALASVQLVTNVAVNAGSERVVRWVVCHLED